MRFFNKKEIRNILGLNISRNTFGTSYSKNCLILYRMLPFKKKLGDSHQNEVQVIEIAKIISEQGYNVDVIDYDNYTIKLRNTYDLIFDICPAERPVYQHCLSPNARKILYLTGSNASFANNAELERIESVFNRKGVRLLPRRQSPCLGREIESFDGTIIIGNEYNLSTYDNYDLKNKYMVPNTGYDFAFSRNTSHKDPKKFLYFGSAGSVHKGLDLLLDVFSQNDFPCELYVCGGYGNEADFVEAYNDELNNRKNIKALGFVDIWSEEFASICKECCYMILPSCSESRAGAVATCMSAGLIPICSRICGYEEDSDVVTLNDCTLECIEKTVIEYSQKSQSWIEDKNKKIVDLYEKKYNMDAFILEMRHAISGILSSTSKGE